MGRRRETMEKQLAELASKVKSLRFRLSKTEVIAKQDREASERQKVSLKNISKVVIDLKESIEEKKFAKGESEDQVAAWSKDFEDDLAKTDESVRNLNQQIKEIDHREEETNAIAEHKQNLQFEREKLEQRAQFENAVEVEGQANRNNTKSLAKLPKLPITKFNGKIEAWLPF